MNAAVSHIAIRRAATLLVGVVLTLSGCGSSVGDAGTLPTSPVATAASPSPEPSATVPAAPSMPPSTAPSGSMPSSAPSPSGGSPSATSGFSIYFLSGEKLVPVYREVPRTVAIARAAVLALLAGPTEAESSPPASLTTTIPPATQLLDISIANQIATVDLSGEFQSGGGSASMFGRLAQVTFTLTQFPTVDRVAFRLDGQPVTVFSGEGIVLDAPSSRADYESFVPAIFVDRPAWGAPPANPLRISGLANVFEATFSIEITAADGTLLSTQTVRATCGTGCWGTFDVTVPYTVGTLQPGYVTVYDASARDGSRENVRSSPVMLTPGS